MRTLDALITESPLFADLIPEQLDLVAGCAQNVVFDEGERLFREGDQADTFFLVRHGLVALEQYVPNKGVLTVQTVGPGEMVGWSWLVPPYRWQLSARAVEPLRAVAFDGACLRTKCGADTELGYVLLTRFSGELVELLTAARLQLMDVYGNGDR
jgi:CRP/FNR family transcriptional regulator, cyclic AMP receptor protein